MRSCSDDCALHRAASATASATAGSSRRDFVSTTLLASVGAFLAACGDGNIGGVTGTGGGGGNPPPPSGGPLVVTLSDFPALATDGGIARVDGNTSRPIAVARISAASYLAFSMICPHAGFRPISIVGDGFVCPNHGAEFAANGDWRGGQSTRDLAQYTVLHDQGLGTLTIS